MWVAHNARCFDVPFLLKEFSRCSIDVPSNWLYLDSLPLAREVLKSEGLFAFAFVFVMCPTCMVKEISNSIVWDFVDRDENDEGITASHS